MNKILPIFLLILMTASLTACSSQPVEKTNNPQPETSVADSIPLVEQPIEEPASEPQEMVVFFDPVLEAMICAALGKPMGSITAAEAEAVTALDLGFEWYHFFPDEKPIRDIGGLEYFKNLEHLDLSDHEITDITPLAGLGKLTSLVLGGNPIVDIEPLVKLMDLKLLILTDCEAQDYSPLANLTSLEILMLNNSTITDATPLVNLTNLKLLHLAGCALNYSPLSAIYANLENKDFVIPSSLSELGFTMNDERHQAEYWGENFDVRLNHEEWGFSGEDWTQNCLRVVFGEESYKVDIGYYPEQNAYVVLAVLDGEMVVNYVYNFAEGSENLFENRDSLEGHIRTIFPNASEDEDLLLAPIRFHTNVLQSTFGMTANQLFQLPFEPPAEKISLTSLGFIESKEVRGWLYVHNGPGEYFDVSIHDPKQEPWEGGGGEVRFYTSLSEEYRIAVTYYIDERKFTVKADDNNGGGAEYHFLIDANELIDIWCSDKDLTVEQYFKKAINDPAITDTHDIYHYSIKLMVGVVEGTFGMDLEELYVLQEE